MWVIIFTQQRDTTPVISASKITVGWQTILTRTLLGGAGWKQVLQTYPE